jgi:hypothetical protein
MRLCLLCEKNHPAVPLYADERFFSQSSSLSRSLFQLVDFVDKLKSPALKRRRLIYILENTE